MTCPDALHQIFGLVLRLLLLERRRPRIKR